MRQPIAANGPRQFAISSWMLAAGLARRQPLIPIPALTHEANAPTDSPATLLHFSPEELRGFFLNPAGILHITPTKYDIPKHIPSH